MIWVKTAKLLIVIKIIHERTTSMLMHIPGTPVEQTRAPNIHAWTTSALMHIPGTPEEQTRVPPPPQLPGLT